MPKQIHDVQMVLLPSEDVHLMVFHLGMGIEMDVVDEEYQMVDHLGMASMMVVVVVGMVLTLNVVEMALKMLVDVVADDECQFLVVVVECCGECFQVDESLHCKSHSMSES